MYRTYIRENITLVSIILFVIIFGTIQVMKPACFYNRDGSIREFGVGYRNKTILPIWLLSLVLGILCYLTVLYYINTPKIFG
jgi:fumarate reductase subunit C